MLATALLVTAASGFAQQTPSAPAGSLVVDPQQGATPRVTVPTPPARDTPLEPPASVPRPSGMTVPPATFPALPRGPSAYGPPAAQSVPQPWLQGVPGGLPGPTADPLRIDPATDPILQLARMQSSVVAFREAIGAAILQSPVLDEANAQVEEEVGARGEARARLLPSAQLSLSTFQVIGRAFSNDPGNVLERSRPSHRTDGLLHLQQSMLDFGAGTSRIRASQARLDAARARVEDSGTQLALLAISSWYSVYGYRVLVRLGEAFAESQHGVRLSVAERVRQGAAAPADMAQVDGYIAASDARLADFRRQLANAEAHYTADIGSAPPPGLARAPVPSLEGISAATLLSDTGKLPTVQAAKLGVAAARADARALKADRLPQLSAAVDAGRYGVIETARDYDVRGSVTLSLRLGGGAAQRVDQAKARINGADARLRRTQIEAQRDAEIALSDVAALEQAQQAIESNYIASRQSRDVLAERFRVARGSLFDLLIADTNYFGVATRYIQTVIELDTARYALLARTGRLLPALEIQPAALERP